MSTFDYKTFLEAAFKEDVGPGDYSTLASIPADLKGEAVFIFKDKGIVAGIEEVKRLTEFMDGDLTMEFEIEDGTYLETHTNLGVVKGSVHAILNAERLWLNIMQRMSGIASLTNEYVQLMKGSRSNILDTRKTTPLFRHFEKQAVRIGGGMNHRFGLYDMIMLKDNHVDFCGGIGKALDKTNKYLKTNNLDLKVEIECTDLKQVKEVIANGKADRIMLDNFTPEQVVEALKVIDGAFETEASGGINKSNLALYAATGVDYISSGALIHQAVSKDISLKPEF